MIDLPSFTARDLAGPMERSVTIPQLRYIRGTRTRGARRNWPSQDATGIRGLAKDGLLIGQLVRNEKVNKQVLDMKSGCGRAATQRSGAGCNASGISPRNLASPWMQFRPKRSVPIIELCFEKRDLQIPMPETPSADLPCSVCNVVGRLLTRAAKNLRKRRCLLPTSAEHH